MEEGNLETSNINQLWLNYLLDNIKNLESMERNAREGCNSLLEYMQIPMEYRNIVLADVRYKNLRFMVTEIGVILTGLKPIINEDKFKEFMATFNTIKKNIDNRKLFLNEKIQNNQLINSEVTSLFVIVQEMIFKLRIDMINEIGYILYIKDNKDSRPKW